MHQVSASVRGKVASTTQEGAATHHLRLITVKYTMSLQNLLAGRIIHQMVRLYVLNAIKIPNLTVGRFEDAEPWPLRDKI